MDLTEQASMTMQRGSDPGTAYETVAARHFSAADRQTLNANGYAETDRPDAAWAALHDEAERSIKDNDPGSPQATDLAHRWIAKVLEAIGGDSALTRKMKVVARETHDLPTSAAASNSSNEMMELVAQGYGAAIEAGTMAKPGDE